MQERLFEALNLLDQELAKENLEASVVICGAFAIHLQGLVRIEQTQDIDSLKPISEKVRTLVLRIGKKMNLSDRWLNDQASDLILPENALQRTSQVSRWNHLHAEVLHRKDLIALKAAAFFSRGTYTLKDWEDLKLLQPSHEEIEFAIAYMKTTAAPAPNLPKKFHDEFNEVIDELRGLAK